MFKKYKKTIIFSAIIIYILFVVSLFYFISPEEIVAKLGVQNGYMLMFAVALFGGFSAGGSISFITLLITLAAGGLNPVYLALTAGISLAIGDMIMFYLVSKGRTLIKGKWDNKINKVANIFKKRKYLAKTVPLIAYFYIALMPLPNDVLILFLAAIKYPFKKMRVIIILGDITFALLITMLAVRGIITFT